ncbi:HicB_like antitoxin of bacterial toxin-antitoxin system [Acididesulfobacillus acetoxydans]|uniref:HicB_like antitoxin of bacterial toxin-antitoxin system n=1 Tax=Acididesulfobacillus acetoxydans TaxID=1561005 RepID=A0A8S0XCB7_9FIRM|nr:type II toxin-antitoxin system HicB family antitoxin [Acididesulfobacillus acetoxydans]CAA7602266.1 HicB_like antitoxin of bacterial toxin-antitoxin system [Acididesulfobacillus acetoxydans]CEJ07516.1 Uncharacterised domain UPF0150 [Acididesulfobacillus acetoxydans]
MERKFNVVLSWDEEAQVYVVTVPVLPGCVTQGKDREEALERAAEAIQVTLEGLAATGRPIPNGAGEALISEVVVSA